MRPTNLIAALAGLVAGVALTLATVGYGAPAVSADQQESAMRAAQKAQLVAVTYQLDTTGLHDLDESLAAGTMPAGALGKIRRARIATMATDWPDEMRELAGKLGNHMTELEEALRAEDVGRAAPRAKEVHEVAHDLSAAVYAMLSAGHASPAQSH